MVGKGWRRFIVGGILFVFCFNTICFAETYTSGVSKEYANCIVARLMERVAEKLDITLEIRLAPFARRLCWMESGDIDIMGGC